MRGGLPRFRDDAWGVNDFPTPDDVALEWSGSFFAKVFKDKQVMYTAAVPSDVRAEGKDERGREHGRGLWASRTS